ncbi:MAG: cytidine deaminase [Deltaproteobacteria bacterium]|nr:cytidine deaminase [Deltaproteobacteria bacterium]MDW8246034.1 cytidine deaminase [Sandaracinaceae bacterium]
MEGWKIVEIEWEELEKWAKEARKMAYAPYSRLQVGAALLASDGQIFVGTNVENASYGLTLCAERVALGSAISKGARTFRAIAITGGPLLITPCGACRQVLAEFGLGLRIRCFDENGQKRDFVLEDLLPAAFLGNFLDRSSF